MRKNSFYEVAQYLMRPPGEGIPVVSAGVGAAYDLQVKHYAARGIAQALLNKKKIDSATIQKMWQEDLTKGLVRAAAKAVVIGVPLDTGAGIKRGAAYGPRAIRQALLNIDAYRKLIHSGEVIDLGDVYVNPHLLHDEMLSTRQLQKSRAEMYKEATPGIRKTLPVSALSQLEHILKLIVKQRPGMKILVLGGDHSVAWPVAKILATTHIGTLGIVQPDAHTDLLSSRLGVKYCFGTWSYHANELLKSHTPKGSQKDGRMVQIGIRQSGRGKDHWEKTTGVKQYWASEVLSRESEDVIDEIVAHFKRRKITDIYFSNDIDGTDALEAPATGTPAKGGVPSAFFLKLIRRLGADFNLVAADVVEVAPDLADKKGRRKTCELAAAYALSSLRAMIHN